MNWLLWLLIGLAIGWLIEFFWDYVFWQRKCEESGAEANARVLDLQASINGLKADLSSTTSARASLETKLADLQGDLSASGAGLDLLAGAGGLLGQLGGALSSGKDNEIQAIIGELNGELAANSALEKEAGTLKAKLDAMTVELSDFQGRVGELDATLRTKAGLESEVAGLRAKLNAATTKISGLQSKSGELEASTSSLGSRFGLFAGAGGVLGALGMALNSDNDADVEAKLSELNAQLEAKADLESEVADLRAKLGAVGSVSATTDQLRGNVASERRKRLQEITGIGPNFEFKLFEAGIFTYDDLADATEDKLRAAVETDGVLSGADYGNWIAQASAISEKDSIAGTGSKVSASASIVGAEIKGLSESGRGDRLPDINGVGAVFARRLNAAGIYTFAQVAETPPDRLREIVKARKWQQVDTENWIEQARRFADE